MFLAWSQENDDIRGKALETLSRELAGCEALTFCIDLRLFLLKPEEWLSAVSQARGLRLNRPGVTYDDINPEGYSSMPFDR